MVMPFAGLSLAAIVARLRNTRPLRRALGVEAS
jgi:hypothetical protein